MMDIYIDTETCSDVNLTHNGLGRYAAAASTVVYLMQYAFGDGGVQVWHRGDTLPSFPDEARFIAHNAPFDYEMLALLGYDTAPEQWLDTAHLARFNGLPGGLEMACKRLGIAQQKDMDGAALLKRYYTRIPEGDDLARIVEYGVQDVVAMRALHKALGDLPPRELAISHMSHRINRRGLPVDTAGAATVALLADLAKTEAAKDLAELSDGAITAATQYPALLAFAKAKGYPMTATDKGAVEQALADPLCPSDVAKLLESWQLNTTSPKKHSAILEGHVDGRLQHTLLTHGAAPTGRWTARGAAQFQGHNFARPRNEDNCEDIYQAALRFDWAALTGEFGPPLAALADCQRHMIRAKVGRKIVAADLSAIESRLMLWYTDEQEGLQAYRDQRDLYMVTASQTYDVPYDDVDSSLRQRGKVLLLACAGGGGEDALQSFCNVYRLHMSESDKSDAVRKFREGRPALVAFWACMDAAVALALDPDEPQAVEIMVGPAQSVPMSIRKDERGALRISLPSGRDMVFPDADIRDCGASYVDANGEISKIDRSTLSIGFVQSLARDVFADIALLLHGEGYEIVHHVHDEILIEVDDDKADACLARLLELMHTTPDYLPGLPLAAKGDIASHWHK